MHNITLLLIMLATVGLLAGCDAASDEGTQPRPDVTTFEQGAFDDIPLLPRSEPVSQPSEENGVVARSFLVRNTPPEDVMSFYREQLAEFSLLSDPGPIGNNTFRGEWQLDQRRMLTVSATSAAAVDGVEGFSNEEVLTQYSLSLAPPPAEQPGA